MNDVDESLANDVVFMDAVSAHLADMRIAHAEGRRITGVFVSTIADAGDSETGSLGLIHNPMTIADMETLRDAIDARLLGVDIKEYVQGGGMMGALGGLMNTDAPWGSDEGFRDIFGDDN